MQDPSDEALTHSESSFFTCTRVSMRRRSRLRGLFKLQGYGVSKEIRRCMRSRNILESLNRMQTPNKDLELSDQFCDGLGNTSPMYLKS